MLAIAATPGSCQPILTDEPEPGPPGPGAVLCRTLELGVCGTDREILLSQRPATPAGRDRLILGHECLARVEACGPGVHGWQPGDLAVPVVRRALPEFAQGHRVDMLAFGCFTERGIFHEDGFSAVRWLDHPEHLLRVPASIARFAVLAEPLAVSEKAVNEALAVQQARIGPDEWRTRPPRVLVTGQGPIGFTAVLAAVARGWPVTMMGRDPADTFRAQLARRFGADYRQLDSLATEATATATSAKSANSGDTANTGDTADVSAPVFHAPEFLASALREGVALERDAFDLVLECTGADDVMLLAAHSLASRGVMVWLGSTRIPEPRWRNVERLMRDGILRNHLHLGTVNSAPRDFIDALRHLEQLSTSHAAELAALMTDRVRPAQALWHYTNRTPQGIKTVVDYSEPSL